jgi:hypothetical protein
VPNRDQRKKKEVNRYFYRDNNILLRELTSAQQLVYCYYCDRLIESKAPDCDTGAVGRERICEKNRPSQKLRILQYRKPSRLYRQIINYYEHLNNRSIAQLNRSTEQDRPTPLLEEEEAVTDRHTGSIDILKEHRIDKLLAIDLPTESIYLLRID